MVRAAPEFPEKFYQDPMGLDRYVVQEKELFTWKAPNKVDKKRTRNQVAQFVLMIVLGVVILLAIQEMLLAAVFVAASSLVLMIVLTPATFLDSKISTIGIKVGEKYYFWPQLTQFWFETKEKARFLCLRDVVPVPHVVRLIILSDDEEKIIRILGKYILFKKPQQTSREKIVESITDRLPFRWEL